MMKNGVYFIVIVLLVAELFGMSVTTAQSFSSIQKKPSEIFHFL